MLVEDFMPGPYWPLCDSESYFRQVCDGKAQLHFKGYKKNTTLKLSSYSSSLVVYLA